MISAPDGAGECRLLFVYGTLRRGFRLHPHLVRLGARFAREAKVAGELFDLGRYPGARPAWRDGQWVRGEICELRKPANDLRVLDGVEGFIPGVPERSQFVRALTDAVLTDGSRVSAWVYWLGKNGRGGKRIASGDFVAASAHKAST